MVESRGRWGEVVSVANTGQRKTVYNFEVEDFHTYFVGEAGVWVHNSCAKAAQQRGAELVKQYKKEGVGQGAGRSGGHGTPHKRAGAELIREAGRLPKNDPMRKALQTAGKRLQQQGKSHNHR